MSAPRHCGLRTLRERHWIVSLGFGGAVLLMWQFAFMAHGLPVYLLGPVEIAMALWTQVREGELIGQMWLSLHRALSGFVIGGAIGVLFGLWAGVSRTFRDLFDLPQSFTHPVPKIAIFPAVAVWLGFTDQARILIIAISAFYPAYLNALNGAMGINPRLFWVARNAGASSVRIFFQVLLPASLPRTLVGLRISLMVSFVLMVATEVVGHSDGLGAGLMRAYREGEWPAMYAGILAVALCGMAANSILRIVTQRWMAWQASTGGSHA